MGAKWVVLHKCKICKVKATIATKETNRYDIGDPVIIRVFRDGTIHFINIEEIKDREMRAIRHAIRIWLKALSGGGG